MHYNIKNNKFGFKADDIFVIGKRANNPKRDFLFISKLLGKHIAVNPEVVKATGFLLSSLKYGFDNDEYIDCIKNGTVPSYVNHAKDDNILVVGFCETATGLGMSVAASIEGCVYQTTTREPIEGMPNLLTFEEEHSHATTHKMFSNTVHLSDFHKIVLVDDEITTGNSLLNLMREISKRSDVKEYNIMTILDWRNDEQIQKFYDFEKEHNVKINVYSVISGSVDNETPKEVYQNEEEIYVNKKIDVEDLHVIPRMRVHTEDHKDKMYFTDSGRFGVAYDEIQKIEQYAKEITEKILASLKKDDKEILVLGHGEGIYIPSRVASYLQAKGIHVVFRTTSLSPIYCDGKIIKSEVVFNDRGSKYHFYNLQEAEKYDETIMLTETDLDVQLCNNMKVYAM